MNVQVCILLAWWTNMLGEGKVNIMDSIINFQTRVSRRNQATDDAILVFYIYIYILHLIIYKKTYFYKSFVILKQFIFLSFVYFL